MTPTVTKTQSLTDILNEIESRANAATPGPWDTDTDDLGTWINSVCYPQPLAKMGKCTSFPTKNNAAFIASARTDVPKLLQVVRELWDDFLTQAMNRPPDVFERIVARKAQRLAAILTSPENGEQQR